MAVAVDSKAAPYQTDKRKNHSDVSGTNPAISSIIPQQNNSYADSPSRQVRRSTRVASLSPSSFTPLISDTATSNSFSGSSSASSSASSYMPASPSRKYSMMRGGYNGVPIDEITINEIEPENRNGNKSNSYSASSYAPQQLQSSLYPSLSLNSERKHLTLEFQPTNLSTPSTTFQNSSGITPAVNKFNIQETPGQSNRILDKLLSRVDFEEIAKATPLGNKSTISAVAGRERTHKDNTSYSNNQHSEVGNNYNLKSKVQTIQSTQNNYNSNNMAKTPQKQTSSEHDNSDETVKVVRTLRNRSIVASPLPARRSSLGISKGATTPASSNSFTLDLPVYFKKHQKNLLAYSLAALFILATAYHIYDGLNGVNRFNGDSGAIKLNVIPTTVEEPNVQVPFQINKEEVVKLISQVSEDRLENIHEALTTTFEQKLNLVEERLQERFEIIQKSRDIEKTQPKSFEAELQKKALESVASTVKRLENKFQDLEAKIEVVQKEINKRDNKQKQETVKPAAVSVMSVPLKVVKHLCSKPLDSGFLKSSNFPPENALSDISEPFKFPGNRGKFAVALPPNLARSPTEISLELPPSRLSPADRTCLPKDFEIWGLPNSFNERDNPVLLFRGTFDAFKDAQTFKLKQIDSSKVLQLRIRNNHGNDKFTCLHRFKVLTSGHFIK